MLNKPTTSLLLIIIFSLFNVNAFANIDEVQSNLLKQLKKQIRWDNVEGHPYLISGPEPDFHFVLNMHLIKLDFGQIIKIRIPQGEMLKIYSPFEKINDTLDVFLSNGSGLNIISTPHYIDEKSIIVDPATTMPLLAYISLKGQPDKSKHNLQISIFISRHEIPGQIAPHRNLLKFPGHSFEIKREKRTDKKDFWILEHNKPLTFALEGPTRLAIENRYIYRHSESHLLQIYSIDLKLNGSPYQVLEFQTGPESILPVYVDGNQETLGSEETGYVQIPEGKHVIELKTSDKLYLRVLEQDQPDYLLAINEPEVTASQILQSGTSSLVRKSYIELTDGDIEEVVKQTENSADIEKIAYKMTLDNRKKDSDMVGAMLMKQAAIKNKDYPEIEKEAEEFLRFHTFYRNLIPYKKPSKEAQDFYLFTTTTLKKLDQPYIMPVVFQQHLEKRIESFSGGYFFTFPQAEKDAFAKYTYNLPERFTTSYLRVIVQRDSLISDGEFMLQLDDRQPLKLRVVRDDEMPEDEYLPVLSKVALDMFKKRYNILEGATLSGPFYAITQRAAKLIKTGYVEIVLPLSTKQVKIWNISSTQNIQIALQYRASEHYQPTESGLLKVLKTLDNPYQSLLNMLDDVRKGQLNINSVENKELANFFIPTARLLKSREEAFVAHIKDKPKIDKIIPLDKRVLNRLINKAKEFQEQGMWLESLQAWTQVLYAKEEIHQEEAQIGRVLALQHLGEMFLAENLLSGLFIYSKDKRIKRQALLMLEHMYIRKGDSKALLSLYSTAALHLPEPDILHGLINYLNKNKYYFIAFMIGSLLPQHEQPLQEMIKAAYKIKWWKSFDTCMNRLDNVRDAYYWRGMKFQLQGNYNEAKKSLYLSSQRGSNWLIALKEAIEIKENVRSNFLALQKWQSWQANHPGPFVWERDLTLISDFTASIKLYNIAQDSFIDSFMAEQERPVKLKLMGPATLQIAVRPIHFSKEVEPLNGWIKIIHNNKDHVLPVMNNQPSQSLLIFENEAFIPGTEVNTELEVGCGLNEIEITGQDIPLLVQVYVKRPEFPLSPLPPITSNTLKFFYGPTYPKTELIFKKEKTDENTVNALVPSGIQEQDKQILKQMVLLLWNAEQHPATHYALSLAKAEALALEHPDVPEMKNFLLRLYKNTKFVPVNTVNSSAGLRFVEIKGWKPVSQFLRVRQALISPLALNEHLIYGYNHLIISIYNLLEPKFVNMLLSMEDITFIPTKKLSISVQIDEEETDYIQLSDEETKALLNLKIDKGQHTIRIGIKEPVVNQFLRVSLLQEGLSTEEFKEQWVKTVEKQYYVATHEEPVILNIQGPTLLYIEQWRDNKSIVTYKLIEQQGWQTITFEPEPEQQEALLNFNQRIIVDEKKSVPLRKVFVKYKPVEPPPFTVELPSTHPIHEDKYTLGGQEDGTLTLFTELVRRRNLEEDEDSQDDPEEFLSSGIRHRYYDEHRSMLFKTEIFNHIRDHGGPLISIKEKIIYHPIDTRWNFGLNANMNFQYPKKTIHGEMQWSNFLSANTTYKHDLGEKLYHLPTIMAFSRVLSMHSFSKYRPEKVDQDIFTYYKEDHKYGVKLSDTFIYRPWLDTIGFIGLSLLTNEDFELTDPERASFRVGAKQLVGPAQINTAYILHHYFPDDDRQKDYNKDRFYIDITHDKWRKNSHRIETGISFVHELETGENSGMIFLRYHFGKGRGYRDFNYGEVDFKSLRQMHMYRDLE